MKIILLEDMKNIGKKFDVKEVSDGYARNFLFPNKLAEQATAVALKNIETMKAEHDEKEEEFRKHLEAIAGKMNGMTLVFALKTDKTGAMFGSINKETILKALREHSVITKERIDIDLDRPIKEFGEYSVAVDLKKGVAATLKIKAEKETAGK